MENINETNKINILFICRANCFRSKVAEAYFKKINRNKNIKVKSAGIVYGYKQNDSQIKIAKEFGLNIRGISKGISANLLKWTNILVDVADDVPAEIFNYEENKKGIKIIMWNIKDAPASDKKEIKRVIREIMVKVEELNKDLELGRIKL